VRQDLGAKSLWERGLGVTNDTNNFSSPCPLKKNGIIFLIGTAISLKKEKKLISLLAKRKLVFVFYRMFLDSSVLFIVQFFSVRLVSILLYWEKKKSGPFSSLWGKKKFFTLKKFFFLFWIGVVGKPMGRVTKVIVPVLFLFPSYNRR